MPAPANNLPSRASSPHHHGSHRRLLSEPHHTPRNDSTVDAIIVPTARPSAYLRTAIQVASDLGCTLVALCSQRASARDAERRAWAAGIELVTIDVEKLPVGLLPPFETSKLLTNTPFEMRSDLSTKRNLGLLLARVAGWNRIVFLDDDIDVPEPGDLVESVSLLSEHSGVGLRIQGFPDNSVVCHAYREAGGLQETFVGGGALAVGAESMRSFFPNVYNEDWFFLLDDVRLRPTAVTGRVIQEPYDPFADDRRARAEEFGDTLAEGVYSLLDHGRRVQDADLAFWQDFLRSRRRFINQVIIMVEASDKAPEAKRRMITSLKAARGRSELVSPQICIDFLRAWRIDRSRWRRHVDMLCRPNRTRLPIEKLLSELGLMNCGRYITTTEKVAIPSAGRAPGSRRRVS